MTATRRNYTKDCDRKDDRIFSFTMHMTDCSCLEQTSWHGGPVPFKESEIPIEYRSLTYPDKFSRMFNIHAQSAIETIKQKGIISATDNGLLLGPYLLYAKGIHPRAISLYFLSQRETAESMFLTFFKGANLDFMHLADAVRLLLSHVAFPEDLSGLEAIFRAFTDAYLTANEYCGFERRDVMKMAVAGIICSMTKDMTEGDFMELLTDVKYVPHEYKIHLYESFKLKPVPLFFTSMTFTMEPEMKKTGQLMKVNAKVFKRRGKEHFDLSKDGIKVYRYTNMNEILRKIPLNDVSAQFVPANPTTKEEAKLVFFKNDGQPFGYKQGKITKKTRYEYTTSDETVLRSWAANMNFVAFYLTIKQMVSH